MNQEQQKEILDKLYDLLLETPEKLRKPIIDAILFYRRWLRSICCM